MILQALGWRCNARYRLFVAALLVTRSQVVARANAGIGLYPVRGLPMRVARH